MQVISVKWSEARGRVFWSIPCSILKTVLKVVYFNGLGLVAARQRGTWMQSRIPVHVGRRVDLHASGMHIADETRLITASGGGAHSWRGCNFLCTVANIHIYRALLAEKFIVADSVPSPSC